MALRGRYSRSGHQTAHGLEVDLLWLLEADVVRILGKAPLAVSLPGSLLFELFIFLAGLRRQPDFRLLEFHALLIANADPGPVVVRSQFD